MRSTGSSWNWGVEQWAVDNADTILNTVTPLVWVVLFVGLIDRESFLDTWYMPFLGVFAAFLANSVPLGGGIIYIPVLSILGANIQLGAMFTISIMPFGNGIFGFIRWLVKNPAVMLWEVFPYVVFSSWLGSFLAVFVLAPPETALIKFGFGVFCSVLGVLVSLAVYKGGLRNVFGFQELPASTTSVVQTYTVSTVDSPDHAVTDTDADDQDLIGVDDVLEPGAEDVEAHVETAPLLETSPNLKVETFEKVVTVSATGYSLPASHKAVLVVVGFLGGLVFVPNIGIGPALFTYVTLALLGYPETASMVTGIITGGWVCSLPLLWTLVLTPEKLPFKLWIMTIPGVFYGAKVSTCVCGSRLPLSPRPSPSSRQFAPPAIEWIGPARVMAGFAVFLFCSAALYFFH